MTLTAIASLLGGLAAFGVLGAGILVVIVFIVSLVRKSRASGVVFADGVDGAEFAKVRAALQETLKDKEMLDALELFQKAAASAIAKRKSTP